MEPYQSRATSHLQERLQITSSYAMCHEDELSGGLQIIKADAGAQEYFIFFVAGSETTGHTIAWTL